jgi:hypothetical protein
MTMPNFLIIGAQKAGTTSLYHCLGQHPQIYMSPIKEPNFFAAEGEKPDPRKPSVNDIEAYRELFRGVSYETAIGEASPWYLYSPKAPERIKHYIPDAKLIAILRDPPERAYSQFLHFVRDGREPTTDFAQALREEEIRVHNNLAAGNATDRDALGAYINRGFYHAQLERYFELFDRSQIRVFLSDDLSSDPISVLQDVFRFLEVDKTFVPDISIKHNASGMPKNKLLHAFLTKPHPIKRFVRRLKLHLPSGLRLRIANGLAYLKSRNSVEAPQLPLEMRQQLIEVYREDILKLEVLIQRDLSKWLR